MEKYDSICIYCDEPLSKWERIRSYCWNCSELTASESYQEEDNCD
ncbi:hypothetical protein R4Z10_08940 [Niallia sp. XMNu-256]